MSLSFSLFVVFGFLAVVLLIEGVFVWWSDTKSPEVKRVEHRLRVMTVGDRSAAEGASLLKQRLLSTTPEIQRILLRIPKIYKLDRLLIQAGSSKTVLHLLTVCALAGVGGILLGKVLSWPWPWAISLGLVLAALPLVRLTWLRTKRIERINAQLPDAMDLISRALRAGHAFSAALAMVGNEGPEPIAGEFKTTFDEISFGISTKNALLNLAARVPLPDMRYFVMAVLIQLETGGNLAELLSMLANLIRDRFKLFGKIRVLAAEGKLSAYILVALPFCLAGILQVVNPGYMNVLLTDPVGINLVITTLAMMAFGVFVMWRIIKIHI